MSPDRVSDPPHQGASRAGIRRIAWTGILAAVTAVGVLFWLGRNETGWVLLPLFQDAGSFHRTRYEEVVERVRQMGLVPGEERDLQLSDLSDPASLGPLLPQQSALGYAGAGRVWARRTTDGALQVVIRARDLGHAGSHGFAFSQIPLEAQPWGSDWMRLDVPGPLWITYRSGRLDSNWWRVLNNLD